MSQADDSEQKTAPIVESSIDEVIEQILSLDSSDNQVIQNNSVDNAYGVLYKMLRVSVVGVPKEALLYVALHYGTVRNICESFMQAKDLDSKKLMIYEQVDFDFDYLLEYDIEASLKEGQMVEDRIPPAMDAELKQLHEILSRTLVREPVLATNDIKLSWSEKIFEGFMCL